MGQPWSAVRRYCWEVTTGNVGCGELERLAVARHHRDIKTARARGLVFRRATAQKSLDFFRLFLRHSKGEWAGQPFILSGWEAFILWSLFGWYRLDSGRRRFNSGYVEVARKNGKSTLGAGIGLYLTAADGEPGAEVYTLATKLDQAKIIHSESLRMQKAAPGLAHMRALRDSIVVPRTNSKYEPLASDSKYLDGLNTHGALNDELHAWTDASLWDVIETSMGSRKNHLMFSITTAGFDRDSICREQHEYSAKVLQRVVRDDSHFAFICALDKGDSWQDQTVYRKANPNLGVSVYPWFLTQRRQKAIDIPGRENAFRRLHLNQWTEQANRWISLEKWDQGAKPTFDKSDLHGRKCWGGLDLSSTTDLSALAWVFPPPAEGGSWHVLVRYWVPGEKIRKRSKKDKVPYDVWVSQEWIESTEGDIIDYDVIRKRINDDGDIFDVQEIGFDRWNATQLVTQLTGDGFVLVPTAQSFAGLGGACREFETRVVGAQIMHNGDPVLRWMISNAVVKVDPSENKKPDKAASGDRIDGVLAMIMGFGRAMLRPVPFKSVYDDPDYKPIVFDS